MLKRNRGITLIALVITIIILIILAGVSISVIFGNDGLLNKATNAKKVTDIAQEKEGIGIAFVSSKLTNQGYSENATKENFDNSLKNQFGENSNITTTDNKDGSFTVTFEDTDRMYYVESNGNIIENDDILKISTADELKAFRDDVNSGNTYEGKYVFLANDITLDENWIPIGLYFTGLYDENNKPFKGTFDGCGHEIKELSINTTSNNQGLFGFVSGGIIKNCGISETSNIKAGEISGCLVAVAIQNSKVLNCYNKASIEGGASVGGIVGILHSDSEISNCYNSGNVKGTINVGCIVGNCMTSKVANCYNNGTIEAIRPAGISGQSVGGSSIDNCYNVGVITQKEGNTYADYSHYGIVAVLNEEDKVSNCYYLEGTVNGNNDVDECKGVLKKTSQELKTLTSTLGNAFKEDKNNINNGYPILSWQ